jgi:hypothetical protein
VCVAPSTPQVEHDTLASVFFSRVGSRATRSDGTSCTEGVLTEKEFAQCCIEDLELDLEGAELERVFAHIDVGQNGTVTLAQFKKVSRVDPTLCVG